MVTISAQAVYGKRVGRYVVDVGLSTILKSLTAPMDTAQDVRKQKLGSALNVKEDFLSITYWISGMDIICAQHAQHLIS